MATGNYRKYANEIADDYSNGLPWKEICFKYKVDFLSIKKILQERGIDDKRRRPRQAWALNETFFKEIDSHDKAYFLGYLWADGHNNVGKNITIQLAAEDKAVLSYFKSLIFKDDQKMLEHENRHGRDYYKLTIASKKISEDLFNIGMEQNKRQHCRVPKIESRFLSSFILGYFDGDGTIYPKKNVHNVSICSCCAMIDDLIDVVLRECGVTFSKNRVNDITCRMTCSNISDIFVFYRFIYRDAPKFLKRKHERFFNFFLDQSRLLVRNELNRLVPVNDRAKNTRLLTRKITAHQSASDPQHVRSL